LTDNVKEAGDDLASLLVDKDDGLMLLREIDRNTARGRATRILVQFRQALNMAASDYCRSIGVVLDERWNAAVGCFFDQETTCP
jgi:hypothetical protein